MVESPKIGDFGVDMRDLERVQRRVRKSLTASHYVASGRDLPVILHALALAISAPPETRAPDKETLVRKVAGLCNRVPGSTQWNAAEWMYDELVSASPETPLRVKPLEWKKLGDKFYRAPAPLFGTIRVEKFNDAFLVMWSVPGFCDAFVDGEFETAEEAMRAAQVKFNECILSTLAAEGQP